MRGRLYWKDRIRRTAKKVLAMDTAIFIFLAVIMIAWVALLFKGALALYEWTSWTTTTGG